MFIKTGKLYIEIEGVCSYNDKKCLSQELKRKLVHVWKTVISEAAAIIRITVITAITIRAEAEITTAPVTTATARWS